MIHHWQFYSLLVHDPNHWVDGKWYVKVDRGVAYPYLNKVPVKGN